LADNVLLLGKQKNITDLLFISDLKLIMSEKESFGLVLLEAMACEVPCIGINVVVMQEVIIHDKIGYIIEFGDTEHDATQAIKLLSDEVLLEQFSKNASYYVKNKFNSKIILEEYLDLYEQLLI